MGLMHIPLIDETHYAHEMEYTVHPALAQCLEEGWMEPATAEDMPPVPTPGKLHYLCYDAHRFDRLNIAGAMAQFRGAIVISHGFTEFAAKYDELAWYFLLAGYSVCVFEHRGHGYSPRDVDNPSLVWVDDYRRYVDDLAKFSSGIGKSYAGDQPLLLFAHSMGGGIGAAALQEHPSLFDKAVLSSPMIEPQTGMPNGLAKVLTGTLSAIGLSQTKVFGRGEFPDEPELSDYQGASQARELWYYDQQRPDEHYHSYAPTFGWVREALRMSRAVLNSAACGRIETPILMFQAGRDIWVMNEAENRFVTEVRNQGGDIEMVRYAHSLHEIFSMPNDTFEPYLQRILDFYEAPLLAISDDGR